MNVMNVLLWILQALLSLMFLFAGAVKLVLPLDKMSGPVALPLWFLRFIGVCEILGAFGLLLPGIFRIRKELTPLAAGGLLIIMIGAVTVSLIGGDPATAIIPLVMGLLLSFVGYKRWQGLKARG